MSFPIVTYLNNEPMNKVKKNALITVSAYSGQLVDGTSVVDPDILIESSGMPGGNYAYIAAFGRYYFIKDKISVKNGLWRIQMHTDVLMTYSAGILGSTAIVARNSTNFNMMLNDSDMRIQENPIIMTKMFPNGFDTSAASYVLDMIGVSVPAT